MRSIGYQWLVIRESLGESLDFDWSKNCLRLKILSIRRFRNRWNIRLLNFFTLLFLDLSFHFNIIWTDAHAIVKITEFWNRWVIQLFDFFFTLSGGFAFLPLKPYSGIDGKPSFPVWTDAHAPPQSNKCRVSSNNPSELVPSLRVRRTWWQIKFHFSTPSTRLNVLDHSTTTHSIL